MENNIVKKPTKRSKLTKGKLVKSFLDYAYLLIRYNSLQRDFNKVRRELIDIRADLCRVKDCEEDNETKN